MLTAVCASPLPSPLPVLRSPGVDRDTVASGRAPAAPGLGGEGIADTAKDGKDAAAATAAAAGQTDGHFHTRSSHHMIRYRTVFAHSNARWLVMLLTGTV